MYKLRYMRGPAGIIVALAEGTDWTREHRASRA
jgi:hypothetical protein